MTDGNKLNEPTPGLQNINEDHHIEINLDTRKSRKIVAGTALAATIFIGAGYLLRNEVSKLSHTYWNEPSKLAEERARNDEKTNPVKAVEEWRKLADVAQVDGESTKARTRANEFALETVNNLLHQADKALDDADRKNSLDGYKVAEQKYGDVAMHAADWGLKNKQTEAAKRASDVEKLFIQTNIFASIPVQAVQEAPKTSAPAPKSSPLKDKNTK